MSEKISISSRPEKHYHGELGSKQEKDNLKHLEEIAKRTSETSKDELKAIQQSIENAAVSGKEYSVGEKEAAPSPTSSYSTTRIIKKTTYKRTLHKTQSKLPAPERSFSKFIHSPLVEKSSDVAAKTIARPNGILFGGIGAFVGSLILFYLSKRTGFTYNFSFFILAFAGFYLIGILLELILQLLKPRKKA